ncbi:Urea transporter [compost metagenome]
MSLQLDWIDTPLALVRGIGQVIFLDQPVAGALVLGALFLAGWRVALWALLGSLIALALALLLGMPEQAALGGLFSLNGVLIALALGKDFRRPWWALAGIVLGVVLQPGFALIGLPAMTAPFILACWLVLAAKRLLGMAQPAASRSL